jgi:P2 family phage contractile tail tube protein
MYPRKIFNFNAFVDGNGYRGQVREGTLPRIAIETAQHRGAGMDGRVHLDMGMQAMEAQLIFDQWVPAILAMPGTIQTMTFRMGDQGHTDFDSMPYIFTMRGLITGGGPEQVRAGADDNTMTLAMGVDAYKAVVDGNTVWDIDIEAGKRVIGGVDQLANIRRAMGF